MLSPRIDMHLLGLRPFTPASERVGEALANGASTGTAPYRAFGAFRLLLAVLVVISHSRDLGDAGAIAALRPWGLGNIAVLGFFMLSGFVIAEAIESFYTGRTRQFLANRFFRLFPPYLAALVASVGIHLALIHDGQLRTFDYAELPAGLFSALNMASNLVLPFVWHGLERVHLAPAYPFVRYVWAVSVEWLFYVLYALVFVRALHAARRPLLVFGAALAIAYVYRFTKVTWFYPLTFAPYFVAGVCLYHAVQWRNRAAALGAAVALALCYHHYYGYADRTRYALIGGVLVIAIAPALIGLARVRLRRTLRTLDQKLGDLSYPVYLNHYVVTIALLNLTEVRSVGMIVLSILLSLALSWGLASLVEPLTRQMRNRIRGAVIG